MSHIKLAVNERAFNKLVMGAANALSHVDPLVYNGNLGPLSLKASIGFKITGGSVDLTSSGTVMINKLEVTYDPLFIEFGVDFPTIPLIPEICIDIPFLGSFCLPEVNLFKGNPDIDVPINLSGLVVSSYTGSFSLSNSFQSLAAKSGMGNHAAHATLDITNEIQNNIVLKLQASGLGILGSSTLNSIASKLAPLIKNNLADKQQFFLHENFHSINLIDVGETVKNILNDIEDIALNQLLSPIPDFAKESAKPILDDVIYAIGKVLDIPDDVTIWLEGIFNTNLGVFNMLTGFIAQVFGNIIPIYQFENPYPLIEDSSKLIPVLVGIRNVSTVINNAEFIMSADIS